MSLSRRKPYLALVAAAAVVSAGCVAPHKPGIKVDTLDADIVFGIAPPAAPASPPGVPQLGAPTAAPGSDVVNDFPPLPPVKPRPPAFHTGVPAVLCPTARQGAFPAKTATVDVSAVPAAGDYVWKPTAPQLVDTDAFPVAANQFITRRITDVSPITKTTGVDATGPSPTTTETSTFTYIVSTSRPDGSGARDKFKVEERATRATVGSNVGPTTRTGDPSRGVSLVSHVELDAQHQVVASFAPPASNPLLLLPLDVASSEQFQSVSSDPVSGSTYTLSGLVNKRATVDACGEEVDGWEVDAVTSFTYALGGPDGGTVTQTANYTYYVATQLGGILTYEKVVPLQSIPTPPTGTAVDGVVPGSTTAPANPLPAKPYELSLASLP